jgi:hypothetical protein
VSRFREVPKASYRGAARFREVPKASCRGAARFREVPKGCYYDIDLKYNILLDVHLMSARELNSARGKQPIFIKALNTGIYA